MKKKVFFSTRLPREGFAALEKDFEIISPSGKEIFSPQDALPHLPHCEAMLVTYLFKVTKEIIDASPRLKIIVTYGAGYNHVDYQYAESKGIVVQNSPLAVTEPTAELAFALMGAAARRLSEFDRKLRLPQPVSWSLLSNLGTTLYGKTLGIWGMGRIGQSVARRALASGMRIIYNNRHPLDAATAQTYNARYVSFDDLLAQSDFLSIHVPLSEETHHAFDQKVFAKLNPNTILINTARGAIINEQALIQALKANQIRAAALDVFEHEPKVSDELKTLDNVVITPHMGTSSYEVRVDMCREVSNYILQFFNAPAHS